MRLYWEVAKRSFQRQLAYRAATLAGLVTNAFFGYLRGAVFIALFATRPEVAGWDVRDALTYVWLTQALIMIVQLFGWWEVADNIKTGDVASDLAKPFDYYGFWLARDLGRAGYHLLARGLPTLLIGFLFYDLLLPPTPLIWPLLAITLIFAVVMSFAFRFIVNVTAFWLLDIRGVAAVLGIGMLFFSGFMVPVAFFPGWLQAVVGWLPFTAIVMLPIEVYLGKVTGLALLVELGRLAVWAAILIAAGRLVLAVGERRLVVQGG